MREAECPYCGYENDMSDSLGDFGSDNTLDWTCEECDEEFEVEVEFEPSFSSSKIVYSDCENCGKSTRDIHREGRVFPFPKKLIGKEVCEECWGKAYSEELEGERT